MKYKKRPVVIEAVRWTGENYPEIISFCDGAATVFTERPDSCVEIHHLKVSTLEGVMSASPGDYIIQGVQGEFYPCKPDIFKETYEPVEDFDPDLKDPESLQKREVKPAPANTPTSDYGQWV